jgi:hypothetical protein
LGAGRCRADRVRAAVDPVKAGIRVASHGERQLRR